MITTTTNAPPPPRFRHAQLEPDQDRRDRDRLIKLLSPSERAILHGMGAAVRMPAEQDAAIRKETQPSNRKDC